MSESIESPAVSAHPDYSELVRLFQSMTVNPDPSNGVVTVPLSTDKGTFATLKYSHAHYLTEADKYSMDGIKLNDPIKGRDFFIRLVKWFKSIEDQIGPDSLLHIQKSLWTKIQNATVVSGLADRLSSKHWNDAINTLCEYFGVINITVDVAHCEKMIDFVPSKSTPLRHAILQQLSWALEKSANYAALPPVFLMKKRMSSWFPNSLSHIAKDFLGEYSLDESWSDFIILLENLVMNIPVNAHCNTTTQAEKPVSSSDKHVTQKTHAKPSLTPKGNHVNASDKSAEGSQSLSRDHIKTSHHANSVTGEQTTHLPKPDVNSNSNQKQFLNKPKSHIGRLIAVDDGQGSTLVRIDTRADRSVIGSELILFSERLGLDKDNQYRIPLSKRSVFAEIGRCSVDVDTLEGRKQLVIEGPIDPYNSTLLSTSTLNISNGQGTATLNDLIVPVVSHNKHPYVKITPTCTDAIPVLKPVRQFLKDLGFSADSIPESDIYSKAASALHLKFNCAGISSLYLTCAILGCRVGYKYITDACNQCSLCPKLKKFSPVVTLSPEISLQSLLCDELNEILVFDVTEIDVESAYGHKYMVCGRLIRRHYTLLSPSINRSVSSTIITWLEHLTPFVKISAVGCDQARDFIPVKT